MTAYELACDIINRSEVNACKYSPRGPLADAVQRFMGRPAGHECFITKPQAELIAKLLGSALVITHGEGSDRFAGFVKTIWSEAKQREYFLLRRSPAVLDGRTVQQTRKCRQQTRKRRQGNPSGQTDPSGC